MSEITAIPTRYAGCLFRSRLEARWAVFFDAMGYVWEYEPQGYVIDGRGYLPDFRINDFLWLEVKGSEDALDKELMFNAGKALKQLVVLGPIPHATVATNRVLGWLDIGLAAQDGMTAAQWEAGRARREELARKRRERDRRDETGMDFDALMALAHEVGGCGGAPFDRLGTTTWGMCSNTHPEWLWGHTNVRAFGKSSLAVGFVDGVKRYADSWLTPLPDTGCPADRAVVQAYTAARSARFEHGQSGRML